MADRSKFAQLKSELLQCVRDKISPIAMKYEYAKVPLESHIQWRPIVLLLGNYSSGKSTLINEIIGFDVQRTGQAPTDDSFTVITDYDAAPEIDDPATEAKVSERDGMVLLNSNDYPFSQLRRHGERFAAHFRLKRVNSPVLQDLAIIDTPGMLDSIAERDRGYDYQQVVADLAQISDLILVLFDPHKAGTVREAYKSLRDTLPSSTFEDRVLFVLNRIDECESLNDLLRVYGTLCWNLSQMTGRKDIPMIHLTYASSGESKQPFLGLLENQRERLKESIFAAPRHRLDHLATFVETHGERLAHFLEALHAFAKMRSAFYLKIYGMGTMLGVITGLALWVLLRWGFWGEAQEQLWAIAGGAAGGVLTLVLWSSIVIPIFSRAFYRNRLATVDSLTLLDNQRRQDSWRAVKEKVYRYLQHKGKKLSVLRLRRELSQVRRAYQDISGKVRRQLSKEDF